jgi:hypothetical protein
VKIVAKTFKTLFKSDREYFKYKLITKYYRDGPENRERNSLDLISLSLEIVCCITVLSIHDIGTRLLGSSPDFNVL